MFDGEVIVDHTRQSVYFGDAVERIASRLSSAIWLEAGSSTPVIRRILPERRNDDSTIAAHLAGDDALQNLAHVANRLWNSGAGCPSWLASRAQQAVGKMLHLPPYQFEQVPHWISVKPATRVRPPTVSQATGLVFLVSQDAGSREYNFAVNTSHASFGLAIKGHTVHGEGVCPASFYLELAVRCAIMSTTTGSSPSDVLPHLEAFTVLAPLAFDRDVGVFLRLRESSRGKFDFSIRSSPSKFIAETQDTKQRQHAVGRVSLLCSEEIVDDARWKMVKLLAKESRYQCVAGSVSAKGVSGDLVYELFSTVVDYAPAYRGVQRVAALGNEAAAFVMLSGDQHLLSLDELLAYDAITMDNFFQVTGIHVNCLARCNDTGALVCTTVGEIILASSLKPTEHGQARSWTVCTSYETEGHGHLSSNVFVYDGVSRELVAAILGITFRPLAPRPLTETMARPRPPGQRREQESPSDEGLETCPEQVLVAGSDQDSSSMEMSSWEEVTQSDLQPPSKSTINAGIVSLQLREVLSSIIDVPLADIRPDSLLWGDLGIDSLLVTEILAEIRAKFPINLRQHSSWNALIWFPCANAFVRIWASRNQPQRRNRAAVKVKLSTTAQATRV